MKVFCSISSVNANLLLQNFQPEADAALVDNKCSEKVAAPY